MQGNFTYSYKLNSHQCRAQCVDYEEVRKFEGTVHLKPDAMGYLVGEGAGNITVTKKQHAYDQYCKNAGWRDNYDGNAGIHLKAGGDTPSNGVILPISAGTGWPEREYRLGATAKIRA